MKKWLKRIGIGFVVLCVVSAIVEIGGRTLDPEGWAALKEKQAQRTSASKEAHSKIQQHGYSVGVVLAKSGAKKPSSDEVDAMARRAALDLGEDADLGFKMVWKQMFWMGWSKGGG